VATEGTAIEDAALGNAAVDHPDKPEEAALVRAPPLDAGIGLAAVAVQTGIESGVALWGFTYLTGGAGISPVIAAVSAKTGARPSCRTATIAYAHRQVAPVWRTAPTISGEAAPPTP
jgi:hypothetical protein